MKTYRLFWGPNEIVKSGDERWSSFGWIKVTYTGFVGGSDVHRREDPEGVVCPEEYAYVRGSQMPSMSWTTPGMGILAKRRSEWRSIVGGMRVSYAIYRVPLAAWKSHSEPQPQEPEEEEEKESAPKKYRLFWGPDERLREGDEFYSITLGRWTKSSFIKLGGRARIYRREDSYGMPVLDGYTYVRGSQLPSLEWWCEGLARLSSDGAAWSPCSKPPTITRRAEDIYRVPIEAWEEAHKSKMETEATPKKYRLFLGSNENIEKGDEYWSIELEQWLPSTCVGDGGDDFVYRREDPDGVECPEGCAYVQGTDMPSLRWWCAGLRVVYITRSAWDDCIKRECRMPGGIYCVPIDAWRASCKPQEGKEDVSEKRYKLFWGPDIKPKEGDEYWSTYYERWTSTDEYSEARASRIYRREDPDGVKTPEGYAYVRGSQLPSLDWWCVGLAMASRDGKTWKKSLDPKALRAGSGIYRVPIAVWAGSDYKPAPEPEPEPEDRRYIIRHSISSDPLFTKEEAESHARDLLKAGTYQKVNVYRLETVLAIERRVVVQDVSPVDDDAGENADG